MIKVMAFDLDGTLYLGDDVVEGAVETLAELENAGLSIVFFTNNSAKTIKQIEGKLRSFGFNANEKNIYTASFACTRYLEQKGYRVVYLIGSDDFRNDLVSRGFQIVDTDRADAVVVGLDFNLSYKSISGALHAILKGAELVVANLDASYPVENGRLLPGCGAMVGAVVGASGHEPDFIAGKPNTYMLQLLCSDMDLGSDDICVIGDSVTSDIAMAKRYNCRGILFDHFNEYAGYPEERVCSIKELIDIIKQK